MSPSKEHVLRVLAGAKAPLSQAALCEGTTLHEDTVRDARKALQARKLVASSGEGRAVGYFLTEEGLGVASGVVIQGPPQQNGKDHPKDHPSKTARTTPQDARESSTKPLKGNEISAAAASKPTPRTTLEDDDETTQGPPHHEPLKALDWMSAYAQRLERDILTKSAALELALARIAELERRVSRGNAGSPSGGASPPQPQTAPDGVHGTGAGSSGSGPAEALTVVSAPQAGASPQPDPQGFTPEQAKEALEFRVEQERPKGFKTSESAFRKFMKREFAKKPHEIRELLDEKREEAEVKTARARAAELEREEADARAKSSAPIYANEGAKRRALADLMKTLDEDTLADIEARSDAIARERLGPKAKNERVLSLEKKGVALELVEKEHGSKIETGVH